MDNYLPSLNFIDLKKQQENEKESARAISASTRLESQDFQ